MEWAGPARRGQGFTLQHRAEDGDIACVGEDVRARVVAVEVDPVLEDGLKRESSQWLKF